MAALMELEQQQNGTNFEVGLLFGLTTQSVRVIFE